MDEETTRKLRLPGGVSESDLVEAITASGYPVEDVVASAIRDAMPDTLSFVQREWAFVDVDTGKLRSMDVLAEWGLWHPDREAQPRVRPGAHLIVECKRSELPYVFFLEDRARTWVPDFPRISGLYHDEVVLHTDDSLSTWTLGLADALGLSRLDFATAPERCAVFTRVERSGQRLSLSGANPFQSLVHPLVKASDYLIERARPRKGVLYFDARVVLCIGVLDAPMVGVRGPYKSPRLEPVPWVRLMRHEPGAGPREDRMVTIDLVSLQFLPEFLDEHLRPFLAEYTRAVKATQDVLREGVGFASRLELGEMPRAESLRPLTRKRRASRRKRIVSNAARYLFRLRRPRHPHDPR